MRLATSSSRCRATSRSRVLRASRSTLQVVQGPFDGDPEIVEIYGLDEEIERAPVHGRANVIHIVVSRHDDGAEVRVDLRDLVEQTVNPSMPGMLMSDNTISISRSS